MSRPPRIDFPDAIYHVTSRGNGCAKYLAAAALILSLGLLPAAGAAPAGRNVSAAVAKPAHGLDYLKIARAYADYMITRGRDTYGKVHSPVFVSVMDRKTGKVFTKASQVPYPHAKTKPWAPGLMRDVKLRPHDRHYTGANPLEDLPLYKLLHRLTKLTGDKKYAREARRSIKWFLDNTQSPATGLYPWGSHAYWDVHADKVAKGTHEYNYVWTYWDQNPEELRKFAHGLWNNQIGDKKTGRFSRHAGYSKRSVGVGFEFPQTGSCYMDIWAREFARSGDPEMKRALTTLLGLYKSMRHSKTGALSWCTLDEPIRRGLSANTHTLIAATVLQDAAALVDPRDHDLAELMRQFARDTDEEFTSNDYDSVFDVARLGFLTTYTVATRQVFEPTPAPEGVDTSIGYPLRDEQGQPRASLAYLRPWFIGRSYAVFAEYLCDRYDRCRSKHKPVYRRAILETADIYMTMEPEVQWAVYPDVLARVIRVLRKTYRITRNPVYLRRAGHFAQLSVRLLFDDTSPLPKMSSFDDWYESNWKNGSSVDIIGQMLELSLEIRALKESQRTIPAVALQAPGKLPTTTAAGKYSPAKFQADLKAACKAGRGGVWDGTGLGRASQDVYLEYGLPKQKRNLYLSQTTGTFAPGRQVAAALEMGVSDVINKIPTVEEADKVNGARKTQFTGKYFAAATYGHAGFKDVLRSVGITIHNEGKKARNVKLTATLHDNYHDNGKETLTGKIPAGGKMFFGIKAPQQKWIRKIRVQTGDGQPVAMDSIGFILVRRSALNPLPDRRPDSSRAKPGVKRVRTAL
ncbi:MAG: hypothetical protein QGH60_08275 [Phycisphaerae bacterium]|nr:hypothetical protein [Phycisphaerae bacterium]